MIGKTMGRLDPMQDARDLRGMCNISRLAEAYRKGRLAETQTTDSFTFMADVIDRSTRAGYLKPVIEPIFPQISWKRNFKTFEEGTTYYLSADHELPQVPEKGEYPPMDPEDAHEHFRGAKYGAQWDISWEAWLRDQRDMQMLAEYPRAFGMMARYTQALEFTRLYASNAVLFALNHDGVAANDNIWDAAASALTAATLTTVIGNIRGAAEWVDPQGNPCPYGGPLTLVVPPDLEFQARNLVGSPVVALSGVTDVMMGNANPLYGAAKVVVDQLLPYVDANHGNTGWYLFCDPQMRPAVRHGFLDGYEEPQIWVRESEARALVSGVSDPFDGSFSTDDIEFKVRMTFGCGIVDWRGGYFCTGIA